MNTVVARSLKLPAGTIALTDGLNIVFRHTWTSGAGQHVVAMQLPVAVINNVRFNEELERAVSDFRLIVGLEGLSERLAAVEGTAAIGVITATPP